MGGMIAQLIALEHPTRVRSLALLMTPSAGGESDNANEGGGGGDGWALQLVCSQRVWEHTSFNRVLALVDAFQK